MKCAVISFTRNGAVLNRMLCRELSEEGIAASGFSIEKYALSAALQPLSEPLKEWTGRMFQEADALIFIGACGIAVRSIAPFVRDKKTDPAVVVIDEQGKYAVSLLSGHLGGANALTRKAAEILDAEPVITTATDRQKKFAVDEFARKNQLYLSDLTLAKKVSSRIVDGKKVGFYSEFPCQGDLPEELESVNGPHSEPGSVDPEKNPPVGICVSLSGRLHPFPETLHLIPQIVTVGMGCRKGTPKDAIRYQLEQALERADVSRHALCRAASIDLKAEETGILELCREYGIPFVTFSADELKKAPGDFTPSEFVKNITGVDNVCERSAVLAGGRLIQKKQAGGGVTIALAAGEWRAEF
ncbi:MAG TPA: cobalt-precorrin 5A hydrolase [Candidatus Fusicatenibacter intestinigallinarum]|uniref:Cobalt-precorrin 5A hydrolase n=1 Tax=Candidatus Fusicatenibacter intestinigallinarum TaxID=2838598 RepID=A0A9D2SP89_9FIRM|nr:cobalt-precorrin 5A hydrolase [Candidatus Fusicatenibacter intestinigallinarum]